VKPRLIALDGSPARDEINGRDQSASRAVPADQSIHPSRYAVGQPNQRLELQVELAFAQRALQVATQREAVDGRPPGRAP
jgi:hypothetical protein